MADGALRLRVARDGSELLGLWVAAGSRPRTPGWRTERCGCGLPGMAASSWGCGLLLGPGRGRRDGGRSAAVAGCQGWQRAPGVVGCCWVPAADAGMADGALRLRVARDGSELLGLWVAAGSRPGTPGWRTVMSCAVVGCQGWQRAPGVVGCCWVPAGYAGMAGGGRVEGRAQRS